MNLGRGCQTIAWTVVTFGGLLLSPQVSAVELGVLPVPREIKELKGTFPIDVSTPILVAGDASPGERFAAKDLRDNLTDRLQLPLGIVELPPGDGATIQGGIVVGNPRTNPLVARRLADHGLTLSDAMKAEGYCLGIGPEGVVLAAESPAGILYATMTLRQMLFARPAGDPLPAVRIRDWPAMKMRGVHDEFSYGQVSTMDNFKDMIRFLAQFKMNTLIYYFEDTFTFKKYPSIGVGRGALTPEQINELEAFAKPYCVEIFPVFEMLGNQGALLMLDEIRPLAEYPGAHSFAINDEVYQFLDDCFNEMADVFDSKYFHAGLDESWDLGFGTTEELVRQKGRARAHAEHYIKLNEMLKRRGKQMIMYGDIIINYPDILDLIPKDIILMDWIYEPLDHYPTVDTLAKPGFPLLVLPGMSNWDRIFPEYSQAMINIRNFTLDCYKHPNCLGSITSTWGDNGSKNLRELLYCGYAYGAEVTWNPEETEVGPFQDRFFSLWNGAGTAPYFAAIYSELENWPWWYPLLDYFRHPFLPRKDDKPHDVQELYRVKENARIALTLCDELEPKVKYRKGDVDYLRYCARMHHNYVEGQELVRDLQSYSPSRLGQLAQDKAKEKFHARAVAIRDEVVSLRDLFKDLWLRTNIDANLHYALGEYDQMIATWNQTICRIDEGQFAYDPVTPAAWIYHPDAFQPNTEVQHAYFRKSFKVKKADLVRADLQLQGDTHIKIAVNGKEIGEQFVRRNLSCPINPKLLMLYDILPELKDGENVITVDAMNYGTENADLEPGGPVRSGGFHCYGELAFRDGHVETILSNESWKVIAREIPGWQKVKLDERGWRNAKADLKPNLWITYPDFAKGVKGFTAVRFDD